MRRLALAFCALAISASVRALEIGNISGAAIIPPSSVSTGSLSATGSASSSTFLRGDNTWAIPSGGVVLGDSVSGGAASQVLFEDASQNLASTSTVSISTITGSLTLTKPLAIASGGTSTGTALSGSGAVMVEDGSVIKQGPAGTTTQVLHGNAAGTPTYSAVSLANDVTGTLADGSLSANIPLLNASPNNFTGNMGFNSTPFTRLANSNTNYSVDSIGVGTNSILWRPNEAGYAMAISQDSSATNAAGVAINVAGTGGLSSPDQGAILSLLSGNTLRFMVQRNGNVAIGVSSATAVLHVVGDVKLSSMSIEDAYNPSFGSVTAGSTSTLTWTSVTDRNSEFTASSTFTATLPGFYAITVAADASQTAGQGCLLLKKNNATVPGGAFCVTGAAGLLTVLSIDASRILNLAANDTIRIDGSATSANVTFQNMTLTIQRIP